jgi:Nif-specific regulatory protein
MSVKLIALTGPVEGTEYPLDGELSVGRGKNNALHVNDTSLSRQHFLIRPGPPYVLKDLGSKNGTFVNGVPVSERTLMEGDEIRAGRSVFILLSERPMGRTPPGGLDLEPQTIRSGETVILRQDDAIYLQPAKVVDQIPYRNRALCDLQALLRIGAAIPTIRDLQALQGELLDQIFAALPAERAAILLTEDSPDELGSAFYRLRDSTSPSSMPISRTVVRLVLKDNSAILGNDVLLAVEGSRSESIAAANISSLLAVPMVALGRTLGVIYLDTTDPRTRFEEADLQLLTGIAGMAAAALDNVLHIRRLETDKRRLAAEINLQHNLMGESEAIRGVLQFIGKVAATASTVLIRGESGTGKELVARAIHGNSPRAEHPFLAINCAALTETLLESELFGHEKGAFTGAFAQKKGKFEEAQGGTVFLDEVGELAPGLQAKLLRVSQEREFQRVGGTRTIKTDIRLLAATNRDLEAAVHNGEFRKDLYYRLNVVSVRIPALRERRQDIPLLAQYFAQKYARTVGRPIVGLSRNAMAALAGYAWPGNVRELENAIERAVVLGSTDAILLEDLPDAISEAYRPSGEPASTFHESVVEAKRKIIRDALQQAAGSYAEAARVLGLHPSNLHRLMRSLGLKEA